MVIKAASQRAPTVATEIEISIHVCDKGKKKISNRVEEEESYKFREDPLMEPIDISIHEKSNMTSASREFGGIRREWKKKRRSCMS